MRILKAVSGDSDVILMRGSPKLLIDSLTIEALQKMMIATEDMNLADIASKYSQKQYDEKTYVKSIVGGIGVNSIGSAF